MAVVALIGAGVLDAALNYIVDETTTLHLCNALPDAFGDLATMSIGTKTAPSITAPAGASARAITVEAFSDGVATDTDTATHFALASADELLVSGVLDASAALTDTETFAAAEFDITFPQPDEA